MEPIPETVEAFEEFGPFEDGLLQRIEDMAHQVRDLVPSCVGLSLSSRLHGVSFTVVATDAETAALDAVQYLDGGPSVDAVEAERVLEVSDQDLFDEPRWQIFAQANARSDIRSTLTLPIMTNGQVSGSANLYATSSHAFTGRHHDIAQIVTAWAPGAVSNADLDFNTRAVAEQAPRLLFEETRIQVAVGIVMTARRTGLEAARERLRDAAVRAGITEALLSERLIAGIAVGGPGLEH